MRPAALVVPLCGALLAGCSSDAGEPRALPAVGTSATAEASPSQSPEVVAAPPEAQPDTLVAASQFARFFYAEVERAFIERDPEVVRRLSMPECSNCSAYVDSLTQLRDNDETAVGARRDIVLAESPGVRAGATIVSVVYNTPGAQRYDSAGKLIYEEEARQDAQVEMELVRRGNGWAVREIKSVA
jgi:hypothetical protein